MFNILKKWYKQDKVLFIELCVLFTILSVLIAVIALPEPKNSSSVTKLQSTVQKQSSAAGYDTSDLQKIYPFTDFQQTGKSIALTYQGSIDSKGLTRLNEVLQIQLDNEIIKSYQVVKNYAITSGKNQNLIPSTTILITLK